MHGHWRRHVDDHNGRHGAWFVSYKYMVQQLGREMADQVIEGFENELAGVRGEAAEALEEEGEEGEEV